MFGGEIVKKKILDLENFWSQTGSKMESKSESKTKLDLENFHQKFFFCKKP